MAKAGIYVRISDDRTGELAGVKRQEADCREYCQRRGWAVEEVYVDNDISAYSGKPRPAYKQMLEDITTKRITAVVVWHLDRLHRHPRELEEFLDVCDSAGLKNLGTATGDVDLSTHDGRLMARIMGAVARKESDDKSRRIARKHLELAQAGKGKGGGTRPFGFEADRLTVRPSEARVVRQLASRVLAGESIRSLCRDLNQRGVNTVTGGEWVPVVVRRMLLSGRIAGWREHHGKLVAKAEWKPIIDLATHEELRAILTDKRRAQRAPQKYLLTGGLAVCGGCGAKLVARPTAEGQRCYVCATGPGFSGCGRIRRRADALEDFIAEAVFTALDTADFAAALNAAPEDADEDLVSELQTYEGRLERLKHDHYVEGTVDRADFAALQAQIEDRLSTIRSKMGTRTGSRVLANLPTGYDAVKGWWAEANFDQRRALLSTVLEKVVINRARPGFNKFDPSKVDLVWKA